MLNAMWYAELKHVLGEGLKELRADNAALRADHAALRTELTAALAGELRDLQGIRDELRSAADRDRRDLLEAREEIRDLRRQLDDARAARPAPRAGAADRDPESPGGTA
ncbi:hypothetical protein AB0O91_39890 [Kitasatospora sp. NPDC089797]|uniref:hypothetical protein n=1 Tax=Kitasatospora sp. NPDC089797 TaxID=3155298 RepID=UPI00343715CC